MTGATARSNLIQALVMYLLNIPGYGHDISCPYNCVLLLNYARVLHDKTARYGKIRFDNELRRVYYLNTYINQEVFYAARSRSR